MADSPNRLAGVAYLTIDGRPYPLVSGFKYSPGSVTRESLVGQDGVHGFKEKPRAPSMSATIRDARGMSVAAFNAMTDVPVVAQLANGKTIVGRNMWSIESQEVDSEEAAFDLKFEGLEVTEE